MSQKEVTPLNPPPDNTSATGLFKMNLNIRFVCGGYCFFILCIRSNTFNLTQLNVSLGMLHVLSNNKIKSTWTS